MKKLNKYSILPVILALVLLLGCAKDGGVKGDGAKAGGAEAGSAEAGAAGTDNAKAQADLAAGKSQNTDDVEDRDVIIIDYPDEDKNTDGTNEAETTGSNVSEEAASPADTGNADNTDNGESLTTEEEEITSEPKLSADTSFYYTEVPEEIRAKMRGLSYPADDSSALISWDELRYMKVLYVNYDGVTSEGELVCNKAIADDLIDIFKQLYEAGYEICQIRLVDEFNADDDLSIAADNTSCFNYRVVEGTTRLSNHGLGRAIDLNPLYNPCVYVSTGRVSPPEGAPYADRSADFPHKIDKNDLAYKLFISHGFKWGGDWNTLKDYQHFEKK